MPDFNETTVAQSFPPNTPRAPSPPKNPPRRLDRSRERYPRGSLSPEFVDLNEKYRRPSREIRSPSARPAMQYDEVTRRVSTFERRPKSERPPMRYDEVIRRTRRTSSPSSSEGRHRVRFDDEDRYNSSDSECDSDHRGRQIARRPKPDQQQLKKRVPCGDLCADHPHRAARAKGDVDEDEYLSPDEERRKQAKARNRKLLYTGLACVATIAAGNNIYQNTKAHHIRRKGFEEGEMCTSEEKRLRTKALMMDLFSVGVVAVGLNNVRMGWKRVENM